MNTLFERINNLKNFTVSKTPRKTLNEKIFKTDGDIESIELTYFNLKDEVELASIPIESIHSFNVYRNIENKYYGYLHFQFNNIQTLITSAEDLLKCNCMICLTVILKDINDDYNIAWNSTFEKVDDNSYVILFVGNEDDYTITLTDNKLIDNIEKAITENKLTNSIN